jgi:hypothetical protein
MQPLGTASDTLQSVGSARETSPAGVLLFGNILPPTRSHSCDECFAKQSGKDKMTGPTVNAMTRFFALSIERLVAANAHSSIVAKSTFGRPAAGSSESIAAAVSSPRRCVGILGRVRPLAPGGGACASTVSAVRIAVKTVAADDGPGCARVGRF